MPPADQPIIRVFAAVIGDDDKYLICQRPLHKRHGGLWEFPGGKLEFGESLLDAARRELREELGVTVLTISEPLFVVADPGSPFVIEFTPTEIDGTPECLEHSALRWSAVEDLLALSLAPSDRRFAESLVAEMASAGRLQA